ncbi:hypothetical protein ACF1G0_21895 [Streptomyces sp. NPDC013953]|uniref:hypothetical protein n=1 Tax=Streptomyces sp. NPDC013953 TaxID=3364868 RepID=UPI0036FCCAAD
MIKTWQPVRRQDQPSGCPAPARITPPGLADVFAPDPHRRGGPADAEHDRHLALKAEVPRLPGEEGLNARMREVM